MPSNTFHIIKERKMKKAFRPLINKAAAFCVLVSLMLPAGVLARAAPAAAEALPSSRIPFIKKEQTLNMPQNAVSYWFFMPQGGELSTCMLSVHFSFSNTLIDHLSSLSVSVNGAPVATKGIYALQEQGEGWWNVAIPTANIKQNATNEIKFESRQRSVEGECADIDNPNNWVALYPDSYLEVSFKRYPQSILSAFYPLYYNSLADADLLSTDFILPESRPANSVSSLLKLSSYIGSAYPHKAGLDYRVFSRSAGENNKNTVYIGPLSAWTGILDLQLPSGSLEKDQGFLSIAGPPEGQAHYSTLITGSTDTGLSKAVSFITDDILRRQADRDSLVLSSTVSSSRKAFSSNRDGVYTFSDFGYKSINLAGAFHQRTNLSFIQPQGVQGGKGSYLNIRFDHARTLISDRSLLTVYINGKPVSSAKLTAANAEEGILKALIPEEALRLPVIEVGIECYNYLGLIDCSKDYYDSAWTLIDSDSTVVLLPGEVMLQPTLKPFPYFYPNQSVAEPGIVVGLGDPAGDDVEAAALLATRAGQSGGQAYTWQIWQPDRLSNAQKKLDMVFLGSYQEIQLPKEIRESLAVAPSDDGQLQIREGVALIPETLRNKVLFQAVRSPWDPVRRVYVILYDQAEGRDLLKRVLSDRDLLQAMDGQIALVDAQFNIQNLSGETEVFQVLKTFEDRVREWEHLTHMSWWVSLILSILIVAALVALLRLRKVKDEFGQAGKTMKAEQGFPEREAEEDKNKA